VLLALLLLLLVQMLLHLAAQLVLRVRWPQVWLLLLRQPDPLLLLPFPALAEHSMQQEGAAPYL
jgi:hypothetical protein